MLNCKSVETPMEPGLKFCKDRTGNPVNKETYQRLVGKLIYLSLTRPDIAYSVSIVSQHMSDPREEHLEPVNRILRFLQFTPGARLVFRKNQDRTVKVYTDASWGGELTDRRLLKELNLDDKKNFEIFSDSQSAMSISKNPVRHDRTKHIEIDRHFIYEKSVFYTCTYELHAIGEYADAVKDYDAALDVELDSMEKFVLQCLAFYQKEIALYTASKVNSEFSWFDIEGDIDPLFKEYWCKRLHPKNVCEKVFRQPPLRDSLKKGKLKKQDMAVTKHKTTLILTADSIGKKIQYDCPSFLPNRRQHQMAGLAAIEIAQKVSKSWRSLHADWKNSNRSLKSGKRHRRKERISLVSQNRGGVGCSTSGSSETSASYDSTEDRSSSRPMI
ncbi:suppressor of RPS4-RLD 1-like [Hibiscus syriacus]|uniref:suppressor of RPS4-RLD 1-like n=1 Tax=Hibiscus syriacus TaxID=106335 RepID=UPI001923638D|nr:suppressor of RPS4-RLD 1-like [Hibiscus syriacus]